jgi:hypothetical protein
MVLDKLPTSVAAVLRDLRSGDHDPMTEREVTPVVEVEASAAARAPSASSAFGGPVALASAIGNRAVGRLVASGRFLAREPLAPYLQQSMTQAAVSALSNEELDARIEAISQALPSLGAGTPERQAQQDNLKLLEDEIDSRGYESPVLTRMGLVGAVGELLDKVNLVEQGLTALWRPPIVGGGGGVELFKKNYGVPAEKQLDWIKAATNSAGQLAISAPKNDPDAAFATFAEAGTKLIAATFGLQLLGVWLAWLQLTDIVLHQGLFYSVERLLVKTDQESKFVGGPFSELASLDSGRVEAAAIALPTQLDKLVKDHSDLVAEIELAIKNGQAFMKAAAIVELITAIASLRIPAGARFTGPPPVSIAMIPGGISGGAMVGARLVVSVQWAEMIRRLIAAGVIVLPVAAAGARAGVMMMAANNAGLNNVPTGTKVIQGGTGPLQPGKSPLGKYGIDRYGSFANRPKDKLAGHELLENLWLEVKGFGKRLASAASRDNPAVGLTHAEHAEVGRQQRALGLYDRTKLAGMTAEQVIDANATAMQRAGIPQDVIETLRKEALRHAAALAY